MLPLANYMNEDKDYDSEPLWDQIQNQGAPPHHPKKTKFNYPE
jgi:hypothetical protein